MRVYVESQSFLLFASRREKGLGESLKSPFKIGPVRQYMQTLKECQKDLVDIGTQCHQCCDLSSRTSVNELVKLAKQFSTIDQGINDM